MGEIGVNACKQRQGPIVAVGGGSGPSLVARALSSELDRLVAVVCTTDRGSSTGACRRLFHMPAPGDIRATLATMAELSGQGAWAEILEKRLRCEGDSELDGMALGNLVLAGLFQEEKDLGRAVSRLALLLGVCGTVLPVTAQSSDLEALLDDGSLAHGELEVRKRGKPSIRELRWQGQAPQAAPGVLECIREADLILLGPGCLYTSLLPCLLVKGVAEAIGERRGASIYICNTTTTPGQTEGFSAARHVREVAKVLGPGGLDGVLLHRGWDDKNVWAAYETLGVSPIQVTQEDLEEIQAMGIRAWLFDLTEPPVSAPRVLHKVDTIRHDPEKLCRALRQVARDLGVSLSR